MSVTESKIDWGVLEEGSPEHHKPLLESARGCKGCCPPVVSSLTWEDKGLEADDVVGSVPPFSLLLLVAWQATLPTTGKRLIKRSYVCCLLCYKHLKWSLMKMCLKNKYSLIWAKLKYYSAVGKPAFLYVTCDLRYILVYLLFYFCLTFKMFLICYTNTWALDVRKQITWFLYSAASAQWSESTHVYITELILTTYFSNNIFIAGNHILSFCLFFKVCCDWNQTTNHY